MTDDRQAVPLTRVLHHIAFNVPNVSEAISFFAAAFGVGPFIRIINPRGDDPDALGPAFAAWGGVFVELQEPPSDSDAAFGFDHISYITSTPVDESARLTELGLPKFLEVHVGPIWPQFHDASKWIGGSIELHAYSDELRELFATAREAAVAWDGSNPERRIPAPGSSTT